MSEEIKNLIQAVINTLEDLDIKATESNMEKLLGCIRLLAQIRDRKEETDAEADSE